MSASPELVLPPSADFRREDMDSRSLESPLSTKGGKVKEPDDQQDCFNTPTTEESRLNSEPSTCPPAPRKPNRVIGCKRKLSELELFKVDADEIERLFRPKDWSNSSVWRMKHRDHRREEREKSSVMSSL